MPKTSSFPKYLTALALAGTMATVSVNAVSAAVELPAVQTGGHADLVEAVSPSVVFIEVKSKAKPVDFRGQLPEGFPFGFKRGLPDMQPRQGVGSGFIISVDGRIVTNNHVIAGADTVTVKLFDGRSFEADVVGADPLTDIALLQIDADEDLPAVSLGKSSDMRAGDVVLAVGSPFGLGGTVTKGIISGMGRNIQSGPYDNFIQTDAAINRGNSGGPLFNENGDVIGVNTAIYSPDGGSVGIGFAVPSDMVREIVADLADDGEIERGWLGVQIKPMSDEIAQVLGYDTPRGAVIEAVADDSPADKAGVKAGDIVLEFDGAEIETMSDLPRVVADADPEETVKMTVWRKGNEVVLDVTLGDLSDKDA